MTRRLVAVASAASMIAAALFLSAPGCGPACSQTDRVITSGSLRKSAGAIFYETSPPAGPYLPFEGGALVHVRHGLGQRPDGVEVYLSFAETPEATGGGGASFSAGNQALLLRQDDQEIAIKNDTCAAFFIRVVAFAFPPTADATTDGASGDTATSDASTDSVTSDATAE